MLLETKTYPFHRVCGEYISNEVLPFLKRENLFPNEIEPTTINEFQLSSISGKSIKLPLDLGGFGISRYEFDHFLYQLALKSGVTFIHEEVTNVKFANDEFIVSTATQYFTTDLVIGAFGKRSKLDVSNHRQFTRKRSPFVGIKYHLQYNHPDNLIALHNFSGGYCGISNIENQKTNLCYLVHRNILKQHKNIDQLEANVLSQNPHLMNILKNSKRLFASPETINEISFETKEPVWKHMFMVGDAAGTIAPLCGNGMGMAIHSAKILTDILIQECRNNVFDRRSIELQYATAWRKHFAKRIWFGRQIQNRLFGAAWSSSIAVNLAVHFPWVARQIIRNTHGNPF